MKLFLMNETSLVEQTHNAAQSDLGILDLIQSKSHQRNCLFWKLALLLENAVFSSCDL
jgi:hypothetical protein